VTKSEALKLEYRIKQLPADKKLSKLLRKENGMTIQQDLQALNKDIQAIGKTIDKLIAAVEKGEITKVAKKTTAKPVKAKTTKRSLAQKAPSKKNTAKPTATDQVLGIIKRSKKGVNAATLMTKTGFDLKKVRNILHRTYKMGKIKRVEKGVYVSS
jgi:peptidoglycan hydrolase-like protein with peptidoglycan-binding domain